MNPKISITVDAKNKAVATLTGMVTVGAKVDIEISGLPTTIPDWAATDKFTGKSLRLRIVDAYGNDLVRYPLVEKDASVIPAVSGDTWEVDSYTNKYTNTSGCVVDFDTDNMRTAFCGITFNQVCEFGIILDSIVDSAQYAVGKIRIFQWSMCKTDDPSVLPDWRETLDELRSQMTETQAAATNASTYASNAAVSASSAGVSASSALASANSASVYATNASNSASSASGYATNASNSATAAYGSATSAGASALSASGSASSASSYASSAAGYAESAAEYAESVVSHYPKISDVNSNWLTWDASEEEFIDTGKPSRGEKGDTGAQGPQGQQGPKGDTGDVSRVLEGETMQSNPTQRQLASALKTLWVKLGGTVSCILVAASSYGEVSRTNEWQDVPPNTLIGSVVDLANKPGWVASTNIVTNVVTKAYVEGLGVSGGGVTTNDVRALADEQIEAAGVVKTNHIGSIKVEGGAEFLGDIAIGNYGQDGRTLKVTGTGSSISVEDSTFEKMEIKGGDVSCYYQGGMEDFAWKIGTGGYGMIGVRLLMEYSPFEGEGYTHSISFPAKSGTVALTSDIPAAYTDAQAGTVATNTFAANADYALVSAGGETIALTSGQIAEASVASNATVNLTFAAADRSGDCLAYIVAGAEGLLSVGGGYAVRGLADDYLKIAAGTNLFMFTKVTSGGVVIVSRQEVK